jgi:predicted NACHT family NTPase
MTTPSSTGDTGSAPLRKRTKTRPAARRRTLENTYNDPALRERLKDEIRAADKGGAPGTWSARKSQLLTLAYQKAWQTADGKPARRASGTTRYLPKKAWDELSDAEKKATNAKKKAGSKVGEHIVPNTAAASRARKGAS